jgi:hypothetical protein
MPPTSVDNDMTQRMLLMSWKRGDYEYSPQRPLFPEGRLRAPALTSMRYNTQRTGVL